MADPDSGDLLLVAAQDSAAFQRLLTRWSRPVYSVFEKGHDPSRATEATVEAFAELYRTAGDYSPDISFRSWIYGIVARRIEQEPPEPATPIPAQKLAQSAAARTALLRSAVAALSPQERAAFLLTRVAKLPVGTVASILGLTEADVRKRLVRALEGLIGPLAPLIEAPAASGGPPA